jgi:hypothetical protein
MKAKKTKKGVPLKKSVPNEKLHLAFLHFMEYHPAKRFSLNLRTMLMEFLMFDGAIEANYLMDLLYDLEGLFQLLETIEAAEKRDL